MFQLRRGSEPPSTVLRDGVIARYEAGFNYEGDQTPFPHVLNPAVRARHALFQLRRGSDPLPADSGARHVLPGFLVSTTKGIRPPSRGGPLLWPWSTCSVSTTKGIEPPSRRGRGCARPRRLGVSTTKGMNPLHRRRTAKASQLAGQFQLRRGSEPLHRTRCVSSQ